MNGADAIAEILRREGTEFLACFPSHPLIDACSNLDIRPIICRQERMDKLCINVMGDAAFGMTGLDIETAVRSSIPILTIVLNNGVMTGYEKHMPEATEKWASNELGGDYADVARALGAHATRVTTPDELAAAFRAALRANAEGRPALVEVMTKAEGAVPLYM